MYTHRPLVYLNIAFMIGIVVFDTVSVNIQYVFLLALLSVGLSVVWFGSRRMFSVCILVSFVCLAGLCLKDHQLKSLDNLVDFEDLFRGQVLDVKGHVLSDPIQKPGKKTYRTSWLFEVEAVQFQNQWYRCFAKILVKSSKGDDVLWGDRLVLKGKLYRPFQGLLVGRISYRKYLSRQGVDFMMNPTDVEVTQSHGVFQSVSKFKRSVRKIYDIYLNSTERAIIQALILGDRHLIPYHIRELFSRTGTAHVLAISGLHVSLIGVMIIGIFGSFGIRIKTSRLLSLIVLIVFVFMVGFRCSIIRASLMGGVFVIGYLFERQRDSINTLAFASLVLLMINPLLLYDIGYQLSFVSVFSIISFYHPMRSLLLRMPWICRQNNIQMYVVNLVAVTLAAELGVTGLIVYYFDLITPISMLANIVVVTSLPCVMVFAFLIVLMHGFSPWMAECAAVIVKLGLNVMIVTNRVLLEIPYAYLVVKNVGKFWIFVYYIIILILLYLIQKQKKQSLPALIELGL